MPDFHNVPVPAHLVTDVMAYIVQRTSADRSAGPEDDRNDEEPTIIGNRYARSPDWSPDQLQQIQISTEPGPQMVAAIPDTLVGRPVERVPLSGVAAATGRTPDSVKSSLAAFTKWVKKELGDQTEPRNWPINYQALPVEQVAKETHYWITAVTAERWTQLRRDG